MVFVPFTPGSRLRDEIQRQDDVLSKTLEAPAFRFIEKGGNSFDSLLGQADPWKSDMSFEREGCLPCKSRLILLEEKEERTAKMITGEKMDND